MKRPEGIPENTFYYHYKHDPFGEVNNYAYEVVGVGCHTEDKGSFMVVYRPLYESSVYSAGKMFYLRPLSMWVERVTKGGRSFARFRKITDPGVLACLTALRNEMYLNS